jgi:Uri superfamily endonuclease
MKGSYVLVMQLKDKSKIRIGKLGMIDFPKGYYCYVGSALGKIVNLENRIGRHNKLNKEKNGKLRWHIDYFLVNPNASISNIITINNDEKMECDISQKLQKVAKKSIKNFGCSDCYCSSHFHYFESKQHCKRVLEGML